MLHSIIFGFSFRLFALSARRLFETFGRYTPSPHWRTRGGERTARELTAIVLVRIVLTLVVVVARRRLRDALPTVAAGELVPVAGDETAGRFGRVRRVDGRGVRDARRLLGGRGGGCPACAKRNDFNNSICLKNKQFQQLNLFKKRTILQPNFSTKTTPVFWFASTASLLREDMGKQHDRFRPKSLITPTKIEKDRSSFRPIIVLGQRSNFRCFMLKKF